MENAARSSGALDTTDWLFVMSDLHLCGGAAEDRLFRQDTLFAAEVAHLSHLDGHVTLVLNGDVVDFLAVPGSPAFESDQTKSARALERILAGHPEVVQALMGFLTNAHRHLVIVAGNHDPELAWPAATETLRRLLTPEDCKGQLTIRTCGLGYVCRVGDKRVGCIHGDVADSSNIVDSAALHKLGEPGVVSGSVSPSAGSRLVVDFVRPLRASFPLIDVLKPEFEVAFALAWEMVPKEAARVFTTFSGARVALATARDWLPLRRSNYSEVAGPNGPPELLGDASPSIPGTLPGPRTLLHVTEANLDLPPEAMVETSHELALLGPGRFAAHRAATRDPTADLNEADMVWQWAREQNLESDILIAGHTHFRRHIRHPDFEYLNTGTWIPLSILEPRDLHKQSFEETRRRLSCAQNLAELLEVQLVRGPEELSRRAVGLYPTVACVRVIDGQTRAWLYEPNGDHRARQWPERL